MVVLPQGDPLKAYRRKVVRSMACQWMVVLRMVCQWMVVLRMVFR